MLQSVRFQRTIGFLGDAAELVALAAFLTMVAMVARLLGA